MPNPKRRHSRSRKRLRRSHDALTVTPANHCPRCGAPTKSHRVCDNCGHYGFEKGGQKGVEVMVKEETV